MGGGMGGQRDGGQWVRGWQMSEAVGERGGGRMGVQVAVGSRPRGLPCGPATKPGRLPLTGSSDGRPCDYC